MHGGSRALLTGALLASAHCTAPASESSAGGGNLPLQAVSAAADTGSECLSQTHPVAFVSNRTGLVQWDLYLMTGDGADPSFVAAGDFRAPAWSPDGTTIAFWQHTRGVGSEVGLIDADGSERVLLDLDHTDVAPGWSDAALLEGPSWSSDGERLAFTSRRDGLSRIWVIHRLGGPPRVLFPELQAPHGSPRFSHQDPDLIAYVTREGTGDIWLARVGEQGSARNVSQGSVLRPETPSWSPDDSRLAFSAQTAEGEESSREIFVLTLDSSEAPLQLTDDMAMDATPAWSSDARSLLYSSKLARLTDPGRGVAPFDVWLLPLDAPAEARALTRERFDPERGWVPQSGGHAMADWAWSSECQ